MKSRLTTRMLLAAVAVIWGAVAWQFFFSNKQAAPPLSSPIPRPGAASPSAVVALRAGYPDPFLKEEKGLHAPNAAKPLPTPHPAPKTRDRMRATHLGCIASGGTTLHIVVLGDKQYALHRRDTAQGFMLSGEDKDSIYLRKGNVTYGIKRCDP